MLGVIMGAALAAKGVTEPGHIHSVISHSPLLTAAAVCLGISFTFLGSFVAARLAGHAEVLHALVVGLLGIAVPCAVTDPQHPRWVRIVSYGMIVLMAILAGIIAKRRETVQPEPAPTPPPIPLQAIPAAEVASTPDPHSPGIAPPGPPPPSIPPPPPSHVVS